LQFHDALTGHERVVIDVIEHPQLEYRDPNEPDMRLFYSLGILRGHPRLYVKVAVRYTDFSVAGTGDVRSAYVTSRIKVNEELVRIWRR
jgi:hypothetical protein